MTITVNASTYTADSYASDAVGYRGPSNTLTVVDVLRLLRVAPKPTAVFSGVGKTSNKLTRTLTLTGALTPTANAILEISVSVPVGASGTDVDAMLNDMGAYLASAAFKTHVKNQQIAY